MQASALLMKKHRSQCLVIAVSIATAALALAESKPVAANGPGGLPAELAATVNGDPITKVELDQAFARAAESRGLSLQALPEDQKAVGMKMVLDDMISAHLVMKASAAVKIEPAVVDAEFEKIREARQASVEDVKKELATMGMTIETLKADIAKRMAQRQWMEEQIKGKAADATEAEAKEFYGKNPQFFEKPELVRASHILFRLNKDDSPAQVTATLKKAEAATVRAQKEDFAKLAEELSEDPSAKGHGGDLNFFPRSGQGSMVEPFAAVAFKLKKNEVSAEPVRTDYGFHVIKVTDRQEAGKQAFDEAKPKIIEHLTMEKKRAAVDEMIAQLRQKAVVKLNIAAPAAPTAPTAPAAPSAPAPEAPASKK